MDENKHRSLTFRDEWLAENISYLTEDADCGLGILDSERIAGVFNVDVFCEDELGTSFVLNNVSGTSDFEKNLVHLLGYSVSESPRTVIWLSADASEKHIEMVKWMDEATPDTVRWYLFKIEAIKVGNSTPIPFFTMVFSPSQRTLCSENEVLAEKYRKRVKFWEGLLTVLNEKMKLYQNISIPKQDQRTGITGAYYQMLVWMEDGLVRMAQTF